MGELSDFAGQICETMHKTTGKIAAVADRDSLISVYGAPRKELIDRHLSSELEQIMEGRQMYQKESGDKRVSVVDGVDNVWLSVAVPILSEGDVMGCVMFLANDDMTQFGEVEAKLATTVSKFLGKQME